MEWMLMPLRRYADFEGRSRRMEYWMFYLFTLILSAVIGIILMVLMLIMYSAGASETAMFAALTPVYIVLFAISIGLIIPSLAVAVRRFHDQDKSGWWVLIALVPFVGGIIFIVFMCLDGTVGENRFGPDPKAGERVPSAG